MSATDQYRKALDALGAAIGEACKQVQQRDPETYALALKKRELEKALRAAGHSRPEARQLVWRAFQIEKLGDNTE